MIKSITFSVLFSLLFYGAVLAHEEPAKTIREKQDKETESRRIASQKIHTVIATKTVFDTTGTPTESFRYLETAYHTNGLVSSVTLLEPNGAKKIIVRYAYDSNNNMTVDGDYDSAGALIEKAVYSYDDSGRVTGSVNYKDGRIDSRFIYESRPAQSAVCFYKYIGTDSLEYRIDYYYQAPLNRGLLTDAYKYVPGGDTSVHAAYAYGKSDKVMQKTVYGPQRKMMFRFDYAYDDAGNRTKIAKILPDGSAEWTQEFMYDQSGNVTLLTIYDSKKRKTTELRYTYHRFE